MLTSARQVPLRAGRLRNSARSALVVGRSDLSGSARPVHSGGMNKKPAAPVQRWLMLDKRQIEARSDEDLNERIRVTPPPHSQVRATVPLGSTLKVEVVGQDVVVTGRPGWINNHIIITAEDATGSISEKVPVKVSRVFPGSRTKRYQP